MLSGLSFVCFPLVEELGAFILKIWSSLLQCLAVFLPFVASLKLNLFLYLIKGVLITASKPELRFTFSSKLQNETVA